MIVFPQTDRDECFDCSQLSARRSTWGKESEEKTNYSERVTVDGRSGASQSASSSSAVAQSATLSSRAPSGSACSHASQEHKSPLLELSP